MSLYEKGTELGYTEADALALLSGASPDRGFFTCAWGVESAMETKIVDELSSGATTLGENTLRTDCKFNWEIKLR